MAVADGVNVDFTVYKIETAITKGGSTMDAGDFLGFRDRQTRTDISDIATRLRDTADKLRAWIDMNQGICRTRGEPSFSPDYFVGGEQARENSTRLSPA